MYNMTEIVANQNKICINIRLTTYNGKRKIMDN